MKVNNACLTLIALVDNTSFVLKQSGSVAWTGSYSMDGTTWTSYALGTKITLNKGEYVSFKGTLSAAQSTGNHLYFDTYNGQMAINGNIMSLTYESDFATRTELLYDYNFYLLFSRGYTGDMAVTSLEDQGLGFGEFILPATTLTEYCYNNMFGGCSNLVGSLPELPATHIPSGSYGDMFRETGIKLYESKQRFVDEEYRLPASGEGTVDTDGLSFMISIVRDDGTTINTPSINTTYYIHTGYVNKVVYNGETIIDLTDADVEPEDLLPGSSAYSYTGELIEGEYSLQEKVGYKIATDATSVNIDYTFVAPDTLSYMFYDCYVLTTIEFAQFDTSKVTSMSYMFGNCYALTSLDLSSFDTSKVTSMSDMFDGCSALTSLDLSSFNTSKVTDMSYMFGNCSDLTSLDLSSFNTSNVTSMSDMFARCSALTSLDLSSFNTSNVTSMSDMFYRCSALTSLDLSSFNTSNVTSMSDMFASCYALTSLDLSSFNTSKVTDMSYMFIGCSDLTSLDLSSFNTSKVTDMSYMFIGCSALTSLDLSSFNTSKVTDMSYMFTDCSALTSLDLSSFNFTKVTSYTYMLYGVKNCTIYVGDSTAQTFITDKVKPDSTCTVVIKS